MVRRRVTTGASIASRAASRRSLGSLSTLRVQPRTRARYTAAVDSFFQDLAHQGIALPRRSAAFDEEVAEHLDRLWLGGISRSYAGDVISGLQFFVPGLKGNLRGAWAALSVWQCHEEPDRALPFTDETAEAVAGQALAEGHLQLATCVLLGQRGLLRPAEFCSLDLGGIVFSRDGKRAVLNLGWTKGGQRKGVREGATIEDPLLLLLLRSCGGGERSLECARAGRTEGAPRRHAVQPMRAQREGGTGPFAPRCLAPPGIPSRRSCRPSALADASTVHPAWSRT